MSYGEAPGQSLAFPADGDYSSATGLGEQYKIVIFDTNSAGAVTVKTAANATTRCVGVLQNRPKTGEAATVMCSGVSYVQVDSTTDIAVGDAIAANSSGIGVKTTTNGNFIIGQALEARTSNDVGLIPVLLRVGSVVPGAIA